MTQPGAPATLGIDAVERETRLSKDVLRAWEKRYGFPLPVRDALGQRAYPLEQVERLRLMKRLLDQGLRPGRLAGLQHAQLAQLVRQAPRAAAACAGTEAQALVEALLAGVGRDPVALRDALRQQLARLGVERFVEQVAAPLTTAVGARWAEGGLDIFEEHLYTETMAGILRHARAALPEAAGAPRILLTSLPGEAHGLGLGMIEILLALDGASCIALGTGTPPASIVRAVERQGADIVALSFSAAYPKRQVGAAVLGLRRLLPEPVQLWAGGAGVAALGAIEGVRLLPTLASGRAALVAWRAGGGQPG
ncbi:MerR family transcriptional regulator [Massilia sp. MS-15]|uniref:MerR family transcriptional regulator n=1 Tax=Massilia sp. MS-15 TaxID=2878200 RepID=UPI001CD4A075|nr:MerR family transcriptional regulator [Massilia sp. MS-15]MCA1244990.1 MerR family transcriptional regulator [Massilia sp. MS-15]